ncbi:exosome complex [Cyclospora cayetanensis]|uniref:Exosome complex n=1 Tax=Cyclospora cayetanensis TaxID=88456 RepID=A0A1D3CVA2_9EIME|nr:exosome complex [Cyclospora cayetanensis]
MYTPDTAEVAAAVRAAAEGIILRRLYTQTKITISILVLADDGSILSASLIAASLALADAGVAMRDLLPACTIVALQLSGKVDKETFDKMFEMCLRGCFAAAECMKSSRASSSLQLRHQTSSSVACSTPYELLGLIKDVLFGLLMGMTLENTNNCWPGYAYAPCILSVVPQDALRDAADRRLLLSS